MYDDDLIFESSNNTIINDLYVTENFLSSLRKRNNLKKIL